MGRQQQKQQVKGTVHVVGEQPQGAAARQLAETVKEAALFDPRPHIGDVVYVQPAQVAGKHGAGAKGPPAQTKIDRRHQQAAAPKCRQSQRPVFFLFHDVSSTIKMSQLAMAPSQRETFD